MRWMDQFAQSRYRSRPIGLNVVDDYDDDDDDDDEKSLQLQANNCTVSQFTGYTVLASIIRIVVIAMIMFITIVIV
jgi:hypothetical protein